MTAAAALSWLPLRVKGKRAEATSRSCPTESQLATDYADFTDYCPKNPTHAAGFREIRGIRGRFAPVCLALVPQFFQVFVVYSEEMGDFVNQGDLDLFLDFP